MASYDADRDQGYATPNYAPASTGGQSVVDENVATALGNFILNQIPYDRAELDSGALTLTPAAYSVEYDVETVNAAPLKLEGPLKLRDQDNPMADFREFGTLLASHYWYFACRPRRVSKAMRLKFTYPNPQGGPDFVEHILIGFEGNGGP